jgi:hypothetical protein
MKMIARITEGQLNGILEEYSPEEWMNFLKNLRNAINSYDRDTFLELINEMNLYASFNILEWKEGDLFVHSHDYKHDITYKDFNEKDFQFCIKLLSLVVYYAINDNRYLDKGSINTILNYTLTHMTHLTNPAPKSEILYEDTMDRLFADGKTWSHRTLRTVFDNGSAEYERTTFDEKLNILKTLCEFNMLSITISRYKKCYEDYKPHVVSNLNGTLYNYLCQLVTSREQ